MSAFYDLSKTPRNILNRAIVRSIVSENNGALFDPSDLSTLYQDAAGTTPVTAVEQPVGLMLDKSRGLMLGPELVSNGDFSNGLTGWTVTGNDATHTTTPVTGGIRFLSDTTTPILYLQQANSSFANAYAEVTIDVDYTSGQLKFDGLSASVQILQGKNKYRVFLNTFGIFGIYRNTANVNALIKSVSVKVIAGNHATQSITASRPTLSARYNLLTNTASNLATNAGWTTNGNITGVLQTDGSSLISRVTTSSAFVIFSISLPIGTTTTLSAKIKKGSVGSLYGIRVQGTYPNKADAVFNLDAGTVAFCGGTTYRDVSATISAPDADGFYAVTLTSTAVNTAISLVEHGPAAAATGDWEGVSSTICNGFIKTPQLVIGTTSGPYQRVNTSTDYDTDERYFKKYLRFDGVDDYLNLPYMGLYAGGSASVVMGASIPAIPSDAYVLTEANTGYPDTRYGLVRVSAATHSISSLVRTDGGSTLASTLGLVVPSEVSVVTSIVDTGTSIRYGCGQEALNIPYNRTGTVSLNTTTVGAGVSTATIGILKTNIYSLIITKSALTDSQRVACERYLGRKSGVQL